MTIMILQGSADITNKVDVVMTYKRDKNSPEMNERLLNSIQKPSDWKLAVGESK